MQSDSDSTMCAKNSDILLAENSLMDTEISISDEGSHTGEKEQYLNASLSKLQMFPSTSTFVLKECSFKEDILEISRKVVRKHHEDLLGTANGVIDITVSYDGTWQKWGHSSLYGIGIVIDILTGLIIDYEILSKYCPECTTAKRWIYFGCFNSLAIEHNELSSVSVDISHKRDKRRLAQSEKKNSSDWRKKRIINKLAKSSKITKNIKKEGETYGAGKF
ncbi:uncharacterized protein TNCV_727201 [Trichonephila clavipes]|nr:uncharacterized protein TNCV_727201 [Trichonephila clavipes]